MSLKTFFQNQRVKRKMKKLLSPQFPTDTKISDEATEFEQRQIHNFFRPHQQNKKKQKPKISETDTSDLSITGKQNKNQQINLSLQNSQNNNKTHCAFYLPKLLLSKSAYFTKKINKPEEKSSLKDIFNEYEQHVKSPKQQQHIFTKYISQDALLTSQSTPHLKNQDQLNQNNSNSNSQKIHPLLSPKLFEEEKKRLKVHQKVSDFDNVLDANRDLLDKLTNIDRLLEKIQWEKENLFEQKKEEYFKRKYKNLLKHLDEENEKQRETKSSDMFKKISSKIMQINKLNGKQIGLQMQVNKKKEQEGKQNQDQSKNQQQIVKKRVLSRAEIIKMLRPKNKILKTIKFTPYEAQKDKHSTPPKSPQKNQARPSSSGGYKVNFLDLAFMFTKLSKSLQEYKIIIEQNINEINEDCVDDEEAQAYINQYQERLSQIQDVQQDWQYLKTFLREESDQFQIKLRQNDQDDNLKFMDNVGLLRPILDQKKVTDFDLNLDDHMQCDLQQRKQNFQKSTKFINFLKSKFQENEGIIQIGLEQQKPREQKKRKTILLHGLIFDMEESSTDEQFNVESQWSDGESTIKSVKNDKSSNQWKEKLKQFSKKLRNVNLSKIKQTQQQFQDIKKQSEWLIQNEILLTNPEYILTLKSDKNSYKNESSQLF